MDKEKCEHDMGDYWWDGPNPDAVYRKETPDEKCPICKPVEPSAEEAHSIEWFMNNIEDYVGGNIEGVESVDRMSFTRFLRATLEKFRDETLRNERKKHG